MLNEIKFIISRFKARGMETALIAEEIILELLNTITSGTPAPPSLILEPDSCSGEQKIIFDNLICSNSSFVVCDNLLDFTSIQAIIRNVIMI